MTKLFLLIILFLLFPLVAADIPIDTTTYVYFTQDGWKYNKPVSFSVDCFGYTWSPGRGAPPKKGEYIPENVFSFQATCPYYGCKINNPYYLNYKHLDYCDLSGETDGKKFIVKNYGDHPGGECTMDESFVGNIFRGGEPKRTCQLRIELPSEVKKITETSATLEHPSDLTKPKKNFFSSIFCFFKEFFGGNC